jgi:hypothetical protein
MFGKANFAGSRLARLNFTESIREIVAQVEQRTIDTFPIDQDSPRNIFSGINQFESTFAIFVSRFLSVLTPGSVLGQSLLLPSCRVPNFGLC